MYVSKNNTIARPTMLDVARVTDLVFIVFIAALSREPGKLVGTSVLSFANTSSFSSGDIWLLKSVRRCKSSNTIRPSPSKSSSRDGFLIDSAGINPAMDRKFTMSQPEFKIHCFTRWLADF